ncbi:helix-turn-helix domain-containing protein [Streptococcus parauberis]|uniref:helix-turn-helix domain-containing protein n=1 Tax=Streptococcus parauberis TaxID=1348 RepID=UPI00289265BB|nr:helix-turn-helix domain-containing protein [Streptococcus parauberis]MDT2749605.1 helix-turn-helix domain-containing protein [Streptococcus parauberis]
MKEIESILDLGMSYFFEMSEHMIENFSINLARLRKQKGLSQKELAQELGISSQIISNIENQSAYPTFTNLEKIAGFFNASPIELFDSQKDIVLSENNNQIIDDILSKNKLYFAISEFCYDNMSQLTEIISLLERRNLSIHIQISGKVKTIKKG